MSDEKKPFHNPFGALGGLRASLPQGPAPQAPAGPAPKKAPPKAVVRMERAGRRGKEVTVIEQLELSATQREAWLKELKAALGCGGAPDFVWRRPTNFAPTRACSCGSQITSGDPLAGVVRRPVIRRAADRHPPPLSPRNRLDLRSLATQRSGAADSRGRTNSGALEDDALVLQGDHRERCAKWLEKQGVKKVSVG